MLGQHDGEARKEVTLQCRGHTCQCTHPLHPSSLLEKTISSQYFDSEFYISPAAEGRFASEVPNRLSLLQLTFSPYSSLYILTHTEQHAMGCIASRPSFRHPAQDDARLDCSCCNDGDLLRSEAPGPTRMYETPRGAESAACGVLTTPAAYG